MPRPGPRPYECVRRAWHSDRHQPIRGSLIQEMFRMASEVHEPATRKIREWQEKLPFVVLKAEEIMYSKANSEAEYMDLSTLWDRTADAIDMIIRKDDGGADSGDFLLPCIEAALVLGCVPRRASRSQRYSATCSYLPPPSETAPALPHPNPCSVPLVAKRSFPLCYHTNWNPGNQTAAGVSTSDLLPGNPDSLPATTTTHCSSGFDLSLRLGMPCSISLGNGEDSVSASSSSCNDANIAP